MNYQEALDYMHSAYKFGQELSLVKITKLMQYLGNPQDSLKFIHIAGTNGKGSTAAMLSNVLINCGYQTGLYISPYLEKFTERIQINNVPIDEQDLADTTEYVKEKIDQMVSDGFEHPTEFEIVTAIALVYYQRKGVDIIVFEVGLGGRLDATNVIRNAEAAVIASISFDHTACLGNTIREIAYEKAGIIKEGYDVSVYCFNTSDAVEEIKKVAAEKHATVHVNDPSQVFLLESTIDGQKIKYLKESSNLGITEFQLALIGEYQMYNALNVLTTLEILKAKGWNISKDAVLEGLRTVRFSGRFEMLHKSPVIVIDGGHNIEGITSFVNNIKKYFPGKKVKLFYGMLNDKQVDASLSLLTTIADEIITLTPNDQRAVKAEDMTAFIEENYPHIPSKALQSAQQIREYIDFDEKNTIYAFTGSLYMIGDARTILTGLIAEHNESSLK